MKKNETLSRIRTLIQMIVFIAILPMVLFIAAGRWDWGMAWLYVSLMVGATVVSRVLAFQKHPDLLQERAQSMQHKDAKAWDRKLVLGMALVGPMVMLIVAGLDMRFGWSEPVSGGLQMLAVALILIGYAFSTWAMLENRFFSGVVRIQKERGHHVIDTGPYAIVRHPGYAGNVLANLVTPLMLSSYWALIPAVLTILITAVRTKLEDETLQNELPGYSAFTKKTRFRLIPGVW